MIKIVLCDDHQLFRDGIKSVLSNDKRLKIIGEFSNGKQLLEEYEQFDADVIVMDITMPCMTGLELTNRIKELNNKQKILFLSMHMDEEFIVQAIKMGANGYLSKDTSSEDLIEAIVNVYNGIDHYHKDISELLLKSFISKTRDNEDIEHNPQLTSREMEIIRLIVDGLTNKEIANKLIISVRTVDSHKNNIMQKLKVKSSVEIVKYAIKNKIVEI